MSQERSIRPSTGTAAGVPYLALPPTAVDARPSGPTRLIVAWHGFDPPRTAAALASALPMTGVPTWRVYLHLPASGAHPPAGLGGDGAVEAYGSAVERAVDLFPAALEEIRDDLEIEAGPVGLAGVSVGASVALLTLATGAVPVAAAALVAPITAPARTVAALAKQTGRPYTWTDKARAVADRLVLTARVDEIARRDAALLLISGSRDRLVRTSEITRLRDLLVERGAQTVEAATFRMSHVLAAEPGVDARPPTAEAVSVDGALTDWFREHLAVVDEHPAMAGEHFPVAGEHPATAGEHFPVAGEHPAAAGEHFSAVGEHLTLAGGHPAAAGEHFPVAGDYPTRAGEEPGVAGEEPAAVGTAKPTAAADTPGHAPLRLEGSRLQAAGATTAGRR